MSSKTHGQSHTVEYKTWKAIKNRCFNPRSPKYSIYGKRGIIVCDDWKNDFTVFLNDMGQRPSSKHSIERVNVDGNYEKGNCVWATVTEQCRNRRTTKYVDTPWGRLSMAEAAERSGINYYTLKSRIKYGYTGDTLFTKENLKTVRS